MSTKCVINVDLADVWADQGRKKLIRTLAWGDEVAVIKQTASLIEVETIRQCFKTSKGERKKLYSRVG